MGSNDNYCSTLHEESISVKSVMSLQMTFNIGGDMSECWQEPETPDHHLQRCPRFLAARSAIWIEDMPIWDKLYINQSNFYTTNIPGEARLSGTTAESVFNSKIEETVP